MNLAAAGLFAAASLTGCVNVVKFSPLTPSPENVASAVAAGALIKSPGPGRRTIQLCLRDGSSKLVRNVEVRGDQVCDSYMRPNADFRRPSERVEQCMLLSEVTAVGKPRDSYTVGYYPVPVPMRCPAT